MLLCELQVIMLLNVLLNLLMPFCHCTWPSWSNESAPRYAVNSFAYDAAWTRGRTCEVPGDP